MSTKSTSYGLTMETDPFWTSTATMGWICDPHREDRMNAANGDAPAK